VIELRIQPVIRAVAAVACGREHRGHVVRIRRFLEIGLMAGVTLRGHRREPAVGRALVAGIAIHGRVCSRQRKPIVMLLNLLDRDLPSPNGVALFAVRP